MKQHLGCWRVFYNKTKALVGDIGLEFVVCPMGGAGRDGGASSDMNRNIKHGRADLRKRLVI